MHIDDTYQQLLDSANTYDRQKITIFVAMSGGVDSSVAAFLLKKENFNVKGIYMQCHGKNDPKCKAHKDRSDAVKVASYLNIPIEIWDLEEEYKNLVIEYFYEEYSKGRTPNPDILCNSEIKFDLFLKKALKRGADYVATGHYAKIVNFDKLTTNPTQFITNDKSTMSRLIGDKLINNYYQKTKFLNPKPKISKSLFIASGFDMWKDQSYFLSRVKIGSLNNIIFPLGSVEKKAEKSINSTREIAVKVGIPVANKKDSTGICFLEGVVTQDFLKERFSEKNGNVLNKKGEIIGDHKGAYFYTVGQRKDFQINAYHKSPLYVLSKDVSKNTITVGIKSDLLKNEINVTDFDLAITEATLNEFCGDGNIFVRIRNLGDFVKVSKVVLGSKVKFYLSKPLDSIAPGQFAVLYFFDPLSGERILVGSGVII